ncbi:MAG: ADP-glyceromanno-heptose 6-epimerase [Elusimicrobiota bacterium]|jgi:ADP-L-glycero-D-manno-heptose 6-epimerase
MTPKISWIVTGGSGFIGSVLLWKLNEQGLDRLLVVDRLDASEKWKNLRGKRFLDYVEADSFLEGLEAGRFNEAEGIVHLGACSSTTETDATFLIRNNTEYTKRLALWALAKKKKFVYASSAATYGDGSRGYTTDVATTEKLQPLNLYGYSKQLFDLWALRQGVLGKLVGIKFFNVFGPNEYHKGDMRSVVAKAYDQILKDGKIRLFRSHRNDYQDGEQQRDFLYVKDAVAVVSELMQARPFGGGLYNLGAGVSRTWNDLAKAIFAALGKSPRIDYVEMPEHLRPKYQYHTLADMRWRKGGRKPFHTLEDGVGDYVQNYLSKENPYI